MLSIKQSESAAGALKYFSEELTRGDYYTSRGELPGQWFGKAAEAIGLSGDVTHDQFAALVNNRDPSTGNRITARDVENHRPGYDFTFGAPKTFTLLYNYFLQNAEQEKAEALLASFRESVTETIGDIEDNMQARVRDGGKNANRTTGNIACARFLHFQGRPVEDDPTKAAANDNWTDAYADPHLHEHCFILNMTEDKEYQRKNKWKAGEFGQLEIDRVYYQALFFDRLAAKMQSLGYAADRQSVSFELAGVSRDTIEKFSRRSGQIKDRAEELRVTSAKGKRELATVTRAEKDEGVSPEETAKRFYARLTDAERETLARIGNGDFKPPTDGGGRSAEEALDHAILHSFENRSVANERRVIAEALLHSLGAGFGKSLHAALEARTDAVLGRDANGQGIVTTREAQANDEFIKRFAGRHHQVPSFAEQRAARGLGEHVISREWLSLEQKTTVRHVLESTARVIAVRGGAGTGKTTAMQETAEAIAEATGKNVVAVAPTGKASHGTLREDGFAEADTLARLLVDAKLQEKAKGGIIYVDEAGLIGSKTMRGLFELAERLGARIVLQGDSKQHASPEAGDALRFLEQRAGLDVAELTEVRRQQDPAYRSAVEAIAAGRIGEGFKKLDAMGAVHEASAEAMPGQVANAYLQALDDAPDNEARTKTALVVALRHVDAEPITAHIRDGLKARGKLGTEQTFSRLFATSWTEAQRGAAYNYRPGQVVEFLQNAENHTKGERLTVIDRKDGEVWALSGSGERARLVTVPLESASAFQVYERRDIAVAEGDSLRNTKGGKDADGKRLNTGEIFQVQGFGEDGSILLGKNPGEVTRRLATRDGESATALHVAYGYVSTSHAAQGSTVNHVFIAEAADSFAAASREQFYVSVSRGRFSAHVFTDSKQALARAIERSGARMFATDVEDRRIAATLSEKPKAAIQKTARAPEGESPPARVSMFQKFLAASIELVDSIAETARSAARALAFGLTGPDPAFAGETPSTVVSEAEARRLRTPPREQGPAR
jgi:conjugative relaxase-like TrwC/TraI family protein